MNNLTCNCVPRLDGVPAAELGRLFPEPSLIPSLFQPRILSVGLLVGEWSEIGIDPQIDAGTLEAACKMAFGALQTLAAERKSDIVALYNFNHYGKLPGEVFKKFNRVQCQSCARLPINFNST